MHPRYRGQGREGSRGKAVVSFRVRSVHLVGPNGYTDDRLLFYPSNRAPGHEVDSTVSCEKGMSHEHQLHGLTLSRWVILKTSLCHFEKSE